LDSDKIQIKLSEIRDQVKIE